MNHTEEIKWIACKNEWKDLKSIGMEEKTIIKEGEKKKEYRYIVIYTMSYLNSRFIM